MVGHHDAAQSPRVGEPAEVGAKGLSLIKANLAMRLSVHAVMNGATREVPLLDGIRDSRSMTQLDDPRARRKRRYFRSRRTLGG